MRRGERRTRPAEPGQTYAASRAGVDIVPPVPSSASFVPDSFEPPRGLVTAEFVLEPLGPQHNVADYAAWKASVEHIRATAGFPWGRWPHEMALDDNLRDLERHARDFEARTGFTFTVLEPGSGDVIGCVYIYPPPPSAVEAGVASVRAWVRADRAALDGPLWQAVGDWLRRDWPFERVEYASRA